MIRRTLIALMTVLCLSGCEAVGIGVLEVVTSVGSWAADGIIEAKTGKSITDNLASDITGKDCTLKNIFDSEKDICKDKEATSTKEGDLDNGRQKK